MSLQITQRVREGIVILDLNGPIILGAEASDLRESVTRLQQEGQVTLALNFQNVSRIDSSGLGTLVVALMSLRKAGGGLALFNVNAAHMHLLLFTKLVTVFKLFADEQDAVNSWFPGRATKHYDILTFVQAVEEAATEG